ncbi:phage head spike fiber domain-containing protein [Lactococcus lactis]|uniref:phage head spike fiber domain-containing protein n=1 Tax=Lactococcus lactis TaxID=1358 RepID=UPI00209F224C|nr:tail fiber domain-containing protein [Lactococcus lactis]
MIKVSDAFNKAFASPTRKVLAKVTMNDVVYTNNDLSSVEYDGESISGENFNIGSTFSNGIKLTFPKIIEGVKQLDKIKLEFGIVLPDGSSEYVSMGYFFVSAYDPQRNEKRTVIEAFDEMAQLEGSYSSKLTYPAKIQDVALEIANKAGVVINKASFERLSQNKISKIQGLTYRQAIGIIAQFAYGYAIFDRNGQLDIRMLKDPNFSIATADYFSRGLTKNETMYTLNGINCRVSTKGTESKEDYILQSGSDKGNQISLENNVMTQIYLDDIYQQLKTLNYYPFTLSWRGNPAIEAGDWLSMTDITGKVFKIPNLSYRLNFSGGLKATSSANTSSVAVTSSEYKGSLHQKVEALEGWRNASGGWSYTQVQEPKNPQEGDVWYKPNGPDTELWVYEGGKWVLKTSTAKNRELEGKLDQAKEENNAALAELDKQLSDAQTAIANVDASNKTLVNTVDQAKKDIKAVDNAASKAMTTALDGKSLAETAKALGQNALDQFNALSVGGRNLVLNSALVGDGTNGSTTVYPNLNLLDGTEDFSGTWTNSSSWVTDGTYKGLTVKKRTAQWNGIYKTFTAPKDGTYTFSAYIKSSGNTANVFRYGGVNSTSSQGIIQKFIGNNFDWTRDSVTLNLKANDSVWIRYEISGAGTDSILWVAGYKWEQDPTQVPDSWIKGGATATSKLVSITDLNQITTGVEITQTTLGQSGLRSYNFIENIQPNVSYAQSFWIKNVDSNPLNMVVEISERNKETNEVTYSATKQVVPVNSGWVRLSRVFTTKNTTNGLYFYLYTDTTTTNAHYILAAPKLEFGNIVTDWSAAPEDTQVKIERLEDGLKTTVSQSKYNANQTAIDSKISSVTQTANSVNSIVTNLTNGMPTGSSIISQISDSVSILVQKNDVINQINVSTEGILISGSKVHITGTTLIDDAIITTAMVKSLDASVITTGTLAANLIVPTAGNMLMNSEFQSTTFFDGWNTSGSNPALFYDSASSYSDSYGGQSYAAGINSIGNGSTTFQWRRLQQDVRGRENFPYSASTMALSNKNANGGWLKFAISFLDSSKAIISTITSDKVVMDNKYHLLKIENAIAPTGTAYVRYEYQAGGEVNGFVTRAMLNRGAKALPYTASTGQVIVGSDMIVDGAIIAKHLAVGSITAEKLAVGAVNMGSATVTGTLDANRINVINLDASQIKVGTLDAAVVRIINLDAGAITTGTLNVAVQINANSIVAGTLNAKLLTGDTAHLNSVDTGNITNTYDYHLQVSSKGLFNKTTNVGQLNLHSTQSGGSDWDAAFPGSMTYHFETSAGGQNTGLRFWKNHIMSLNSDQNTGLYLNPYGGTQVRVTSRTDDNTYLAINASAFNVASDRRFKSDIQDYEEDALSIVNSLRIRTYEKSGKREIGVIADEAPDNLLLKDEKGDMLSLYDYSSIAIKAIQELTEEVSSLKQQMKEMEKHIA